MYEDLNMLRNIAGQDAADKAARHRERIEAIGREGHQHQLDLTRPKKATTPPVISARSCPAR